jgi:hypothetical protein
MALNPEWATYDAYHEDQILAAWPEPASCSDMLDDIRVEVAEMEFKIPVDLVSERPENHFTDFLNESQSLFFERREPPASKRLIRPRLMLYIIIADALIYSYSCRETDVD